MDFLRMEGEANFLSFLPADARIPARDYWYRDTNDRVKNMVYGTDFAFTDQTGIVYRTQNPQQELFKLLADHVGNNLSQEFSLEGIEDKSLQKILLKLEDLRGPGLSALPQTSILRIDNLTEGSQYFTIIIHLGFSNVSHLFANNKRLLPEENYLTVMPGIVGAYPNAFFHVERDEINQFIEGFAAVKTAQDYTAFGDRYAIRRTRPDFWAFSDSLHKSFARQRPVHSGILDLGRFENR